jgi:SRSO17 transposase
LPGDCIFEIWANVGNGAGAAFLPISVSNEAQIALKQIRKAVEDGTPTAPVLADAAYGNDSQFRTTITELGLTYMVGVQSSTTVWKPGEAPLEKKPWKGQGRPTSLLRRDKNHQPVSVKQVAVSLASTAWRNVSWREGSQQTLRSRFAAVRVRPAHRDTWRSQPHPEEWLLMEWPRGDAEPTKYWLSTLGENLSLKQLVYRAKHR